MKGKQLIDSLGVHSNRIEQNNACRWYFKV